MDYLDYIPRNRWSEEGTQIVLYRMMLIPDYGYFFFELITITLPKAQ